MHIDPLNQIERLSLLDWILSPEEREHFISLLPNLTEFDLDGVVTIKELAHYSKILPKLTSLSLKENWRWVSNKFEKQREAETKKCLV